MGALRHSPGCGCCNCTRDVQISVHNCFASTITSEVQSLAVTGSPTGGFFWLGDGTNRVSVPYNADAATLRSLIASLPGIGGGNVACAADANNDPLPAGPITITYQGALKGEAVPLLIASTDDGHGGSTLTGGSSPSVAVTETTRGGDATNIPPGASATLTSDERQQIAIAGKPTGGYFKAGDSQGNTVQVPYNASPSQLQSLLESLPAIGAGNVSCTVPVSGQTFPAWPITVTWQGALKGQAVPLLTASTDDGKGGNTLTGGNNPSVSVAELLAGGTVLGPVAVDNLGHATFKAVPAGPWEYDASATDYLDATGHIEVTCSTAGAPPATAVAAMTPVNGKIIADGTPAPFAPPATISVGMGSDAGGTNLGTATLTLTGATAGTAHYTGTLKGAPNALFSGPGGDATVDFTIFLRVGCSVGMCVMWVLNIPGFPGIGNRDFPVADCNDCGEPSPFGVHLSGFPYEGTCAYCTNYSDGNTGFGTGQNYVFQMSCGEPVTFTDEGFIGVEVWGGGCYSAPVNLTLGNGASFAPGQGQANVVIGSAINDQMYILYGGKGSTAACPTCSAS